MVYIRGRPLRSSKLQRNAEDVKVFFEKSATSCSDNKWVLWSGCTKELNFKKGRCLLLCKKCQILTAVCSQSFWRNGSVLILLEPHTGRILHCKFSQPRRSMFTLFSFELFWSRDYAELLNKGLRLVNTFINVYCHTYLVIIWSFVVRLDDWYLPKLPQGQIWKQHN